MRRKLLTHQWERQAGLNPKPCLTLRCHIHCSVHVPCEKQSPSCTERNTEAKAVAATPTNLVSLAISRTSVDIFKFVHISRTMGVVLISWATSSELEYTVVILRIVFLKSSSTPLNCESCWSSSLEALNCKCFQNLLSGCLLNYRISSHVAQQVYNVGDVSYNYCSICQITEEPLCISSPPRRTGSAQITGSKKTITGRNRLPLC